MAAKKKAKKGKSKMRVGSTVCKKTKGRILCLHKYRDGRVRIVGGGKKKKAATKKRKSR